MSIMAKSLKSVKSRIEVKNGDGTKIDELDDVGEKQGWA
jgi:hypothetical protein